MAYPTAFLQVGLIVPGWNGWPPLDPIPLQTTEAGGFVTNVYVKLNGGVQSKADIVHHFETEYCRLALTLSYNPHVDFLMVAIDRSVDWLAIPVVSGMFKEGDRFIHDGRGYQLTLLFVDIGTGMICSMRDVPISPRMSIMLDDVIAAQQKVRNAFTEDDYHEAIITAADLWMNTTEMLAEASLMVLVSA